MAYRGPPSTHCQVKCVISGPSFLVRDQVESAGISSVDVKYKRSNIEKYSKMFEEPIALIRVVSSPLMAAWAKMAKKQNKTKKLDWTQQEHQ